MKNKKELTPLKKFIFVLIMISVGIYCIATGVWGISESGKKSLNHVFTQSFKKGNLFEGCVAAASPAILEIDHKINYLIPSGKEYYYLILSEDYSKAITVRADKNFGKSFDSNWMSKDKVVIKGRIKVLPYQVRDRLNEIKNNFAESDQGFNIIGDYYIDTIGSNLYKLRILLGICILLMLFLAYLIIRKTAFLSQTVFRKIVPIIVIIDMLVVLILSIYLISIK
jgi:hypothetical protein